MLIFCVKREALRERDNWRLIAVFLRILREQKTKDGLKGYWIEEEILMAKKTKEQISFNMKQVKSKDSDIELMLRKELWSRGLRYRKNVIGIVGKPDVVFKAKKIAVFCDSEFWHGYDWENRKGDFKSNKDFWIPKIERNIERDKEVNKSLEDEGWKVLRFWGRDIKKRCKECADTIQKALEEDQ